MTATLARVSFTPTPDPSVWYAQSRTRPGVEYRIEGVGGDSPVCHCPAMKHCQHLIQLDELIALAMREPIPFTPKGQPKLAGFQKATKEQSKLRMALIGPSGSGKTYTALAIAKHLDLGKIAFIDTERGSASKYASEFDFDVLTLDPPFTVDKYIEAIRMAGDAGYGVLIIDSMSHAWAGAGGLLEFVDNRKNASGGKDGFSAWGQATPKQNHFIDAILGSTCHVIATMRSKMTYVPTKDERTGKNVIEKLGLQPVQRDGVEYEFDIIGDLDEHNTLTISKTRASNLSEYVANKPGAELAGMIRTWLLEGVPVSATPDHQPQEDNAWEWMPAYKAARAKAGRMPHATVAAFINADPDDLAAVDIYLRSNNLTVERLVSLAADWQAAGGKGRAASPPKPEPVATVEGQAVERPIDWNDLGSGETFPGRGERAS